MIYEVVVYYFPAVIGIGLLSLKQQYSPHGTSVVVFISRSIGTAS